MSRRAFTMICLIILCCCSRSSVLDGNSVNANWLNFKYKEVRGYVTRTPWTNELIVTNDSLSKLASERFTIVLNAAQEQELIELITNTSTEVDSSFSDCFYPRHGFVFWDSLMRPAAHISICFECNIFEATPALSKLNLIKLEKFCREIGLPVFDNPIEHEEYFDSLEQTSSIK